MIACLWSIHNPTLFFIDSSFDHQICRNHSMLWGRSASCSITAEANSAYPHQKLYRFFLLRRRTTPPTTAIPIPTYGCQFTLCWLSAVIEFPDIHNLLFGDVGKPRVQAHDQAYDEENDADVLHDAFLS